MKKGRNPNCQKCGFVKLLPENWITVSLVNQYSGFFISQGEMNPQGIEYALKLEGLKDRKDLVQKITIYMTNALQAMRGD